MSAPISKIGLAAGLITTAVSAWMINGRAERADLWEVEVDSFERDFDHNFMLKGKGLWSGTGLEPFVGKWVKLNHEGPFGLFKTGRSWAAGIKGFFTEILATPFTALAIGGLYATAHYAGMKSKPHDWVIGGLKMIKDSGVFQTLGQTVKDFFRTTNFNITGKAQALLRGMASGPGLLLGAVAALTLLQFSKVMNGDEQEELLKP